MRSRAYEVLRAVGGVCGLVVTLIGLHAAGGGGGSAPPADPQELLWWLQGRDPLAASVGVLRLVALAAAWYLAAVSLLTLVVRLTTARRPAVLRGVAMSITARRAARLVLGGAVVTAMLAPSAAAAATAPGAPGTPGRVATSAADGTDPATDGATSAQPLTVVGVGWSPPGTAEFLDRLTADADPTATADDTADTDVAQDPDVAFDPDAHPAGGTDPEERDAATRGRVHEVAIGESFWTIAAEVVAGEAGGSVDDGRVAAYWLALIEENRHRLVDQDDPDLLLPGQELILPW